MTERPQRERGVPVIVLAVSLAFASGATDIASFVRLGGVFSSVMTGNLVLLGLAVAHSSGELAAHSGVTFAGYVAGVALAARIAARAPKSDELWPPIVSNILSIELVALIGLTIGWNVAGSRPSNPWQFVLLAFASLAMGLQSGAMRNVATSLSTTYLTGTITGAVTALVQRARPRSSSHLSLAVIGAAGLGAAASGGLLLSATALVPFVPLVCVAAVVTTSATIGAHH